jgi:hypothetical protein
MEISFRMRAENRNARRDRRALHFLSDSSVLSSEN